MTKTITAIAAAIFSASVFAAPSPSTGLYELATTGWADAYAAEIGGNAYDKTGGMPGKFTYDVDKELQLSSARELLGEGEFLAPHFAISPKGELTIMVAPHLLVDGEVVKGAGQPDNFIVVNTFGKAERFDYSDDVK